MVRTVTQSLIHLMSPSQIFTFMSTALHLHVLHILKLWLGELSHHHRLLLRGQLGQIIHLGNEIRVLRVNKLSELLLKLLHRWFSGMLGV